MTYPNDFTNPQDVFGDLVNMAVFPVTGISNVSGEWRFACTFGEDIPDVNPNTPLVYTYPLANGEYEIVKVVSCNRASGYIAVDRAQEGTDNLAYGANGHLVQEPTAGTYTALKNLLLLTQKYAGRMGTSLPETCEPGNFFFNLNTGAFYACFVTNTWTRLDLVDHGALTGIDAANAHTIYKTLVQAIAWHDALVKKHIANAMTHDHSDSFVGAGKPMRKFRNGTLAARPAPQNAGDVYVATDTRAFYISRTGAEWEAYSTVPRGTVMMFEVGCPTGWERVTAFDGRFPRGAPAGVWSGLTTGGTDTHQHDMPTLVDHSHTVLATGAQSSQDGNHQHNLNTYTGSGSGYVPAETFVAVNGKYIDTGSNGSHSHSVTMPSVTTGDAGVASPKTQIVDGRPPFLSLLFCRKQ